MIAIPKKAKRYLNCVVPWIETNYYVPRISAKTGKQVLSKQPYRVCRQEPVYYRATYLRFFNKGMFAYVKKLTRS